jgi:putative hydrolase of the HAD superfamily
MKMHRSPRAFLFDMDGTLLLSTQTPDESWQQVSSQFAPRLHLGSQMVLQALRVSYARHKREIINDPDRQRRDRLEPFAMEQEMVEQALLAVGVDDEPLTLEMVHAYEALRETYRELAPHALETLRTLQAQHKHLGLLTNGNATYQHRKIERHGLTAFFDCMLIEEEFGLAKSDPRIYLAALEQLQVTPQETWMVGDDLVFDIATPQQVGITAVWFDPANQGLPKESKIRPDYTIHTLLELLS